MGAWLEGHEGSQGSGADERDLDLDLRVALGIEGFRWFRWRRGMGESAPFSEPGRFVGHPGDLLAHLWTETDEGAPLADRPWDRLPRYSVEVGLALRAAERAGLFVGPGTALGCTAAGEWWIRREEGARVVADDCLPRLLCRAALRMAETDEAGGWAR